MKYTFFQDHSCGRCLQFLFQLIVLIVLNAALSTTIILDDPYSGDRYYDVNLEEVKIQDPIVRQGKSF